MKFLLDTHAAIWLLEGNQRLGSSAKRALEAEGQESVAISDISLLEIAMLAQRGVIELQPSITRGLGAFAKQLAVLPIDARVAADAAQSDLPQRDPFDRVIVATAKAHRLVLITRDEKIVNAGIVPTLW